MERLSSTPENLSDRDLEAAIVRGDENAFRALYFKYREELLGVASRRLLNPADAEEAVQETFLAIFRSLADRDNSHPLRPWMFRILSNRILESARRRDRMPHGTEIEELDGLASQANHGSDDLSVMEETQDLEGRIELLRHWLPVCLDQHTSPECRASVLHKLLMDVVVLCDECPTSTRNDQVRKVKACLKKKLEHLRGERE